MLDIGLDSLGAADVRESIQAGSQPLDNKSLIEEKSKFWENVHTEKNLPTEKLFNAIGRACESIEENDPSEKKETWSKTKIRECVIVKCTKKGGGGEWGPKLRMIFSLKK